MIKFQLEGITYQHDGSSVNTEYLALRNKMYNDSILPWHIDKSSGREYALASCYEISSEFHNEIRNATNDLGAIYNKIAEYLYYAHDSILINLGIPEVLIPYVRFNPMANLFSPVARFDFANTFSGLKMLEVNSDTPCLIMECFSANESACKYLRGTNPNKSMLNDIADAFQATVNAYQEAGWKRTNGKVVFSAINYSIEDSETAKFLMRCSGFKAKDCVYVPLEDLRITNGRLCYFNSERQDYEVIDVLYRLHPLDYLPADKDIDGFPTGIELLNLVKQKKLILINPPKAVITQSKAVQALIWGLHEEHSNIFTQEEHAIIRKYMLPTYLDSDSINGKKVVRKPFFGREGGAVAIFDEHGGEVAKDLKEYYWEQAVVFQEFAEAETATVQTMYGNTTGKLVWGSFYLNGKPSAIGARFGGLITNADNHFLPVVIYDDSYEFNQL